MEILIKGKNRDKTYDMIVKSGDNNSFVGRFNTKEEKETKEGYYMKFKTEGEMKSDMIKLEEKGKIEIL